MFPPNSILKWTLWSHLCMFFVYVGCVWNLLDVLQQEVWLWDLVSWRKLYKPQRLYISGHVFMQTDPASTWSNNRLWVAVSRWLWYTSVYSVHSWICSLNSIVVIVESQKRGHKHSTDLAPHRSSCMIRWSGEPCVSKNRDAMALKKQEEVMLRPSYKASSRTWRLWKVGGVCYAGRESTTIT